MAKINTNQNKKLTIGIDPDNMKDVLKLKSLIELETFKILSLGHVTTLGAIVCSKIMTGETPTKADVLEISNSLKG